MRAWILQIASVLCLAVGGYLVYDAYQDLTWGRRAIAEAGSAAWSPGYIQDRILAESAARDKSGAESRNTGLLLVASALIMDGIAATLRKLPKTSKAAAATAAAASSNP